MAAMINPESEGKAEAERFREKFALGLKPINDLVMLVEAAMGADISVVNADPGEHGLVMHDPVCEATYIAVAATPHPMRQRSSLAHELAHVLFGDYSVKGASQLSERTPEEKRADCFSRHLLAPEKGVLKQLEDRGVYGEDTMLRPLRLEDLSALVHDFKVSPSLMTIVLSNLGLITAHDTKRHWMGCSTAVLATKFGWLEQYRIMQCASQQIRAPRRLLARAIAAYELGVVSAQTIATLRGVSEKQILNDFSDAGIYPHRAEVEFASAYDLPAATVEWEDY